MSPATPPSRKLSTLLASGTPVVLDGALATYLETLGADISTALWSAQLLYTNPSLIQKTHLDYYAAGADIAITASYQASIPGLTTHLKISATEAKALVEKSVELAQAARDECYAAQTVGAKERTLLVAGSVGPYGAYLANGSEYRGDYDIPIDDMKAFHRGRIEALIEAGVDILAIETIPSYSETLALTTLLASDFPDVEAYFSFTLRSSTHISDNTPLSQITNLLSQYPNIVAVGVNCVQQDTALAAIKELKKLTSKPLLVYPNSGEEWNAEIRDWEGKRTEGTGLADMTKRYRDAGARMIGGCCRTTPRDIKVIAETSRDFGFS